MVDGSAAGAGARAGAGTERSAADPPVPTNTSCLGETGACSTAREGAEEGGALKMMDRISSSCRILGTGPGADGEINRSPSSSFPDSDLRT